MILLMATGERDVLYCLLLIWGAPKNLRVYGCRLFQAKGLLTL